MVDGAHLNLANFLDKSSGENMELHDFYLFEPWDVAKRSPETLDWAKKDGVYSSLYDPDFTKFVGEDPKPFQTGYLLSDKFFRIKFGGNQIGKSFGPYVEAIIMLSGELPICFRFDKGVDTRVKRRVSEPNVHRFGRHCLETGKILDYDTTVPHHESWDCGNIIGVGKFPASKFCDPGKVVWLGTYMKAMNEYWWPRFKNPDIRIFPEHMIDTRRGANGFSEKDHIVYFHGGRQLSIITYESGYNRFEALKAHACIMDEEPEDERIVQAVQQHCDYMSLIETPYRGLTYTRDLVFGKMSPEKEVFHATQYDSPYQNHAQIDVKRGNMPPWEVDARIWGLHSEVRGRPYFHREKISNWRRKYTGAYKLMRFHPNDAFHKMRSHPEYSSLPGLVDVECTFQLAANEDHQDVWRVYEEPNENYAYLVTADPAEGAETVEKAGDWSAALMSRPPDPERGETTPVIVASLRSTLPAIEFANVCAYAARNYNNAVMCGETRRQAANATFALELDDWPWWFSHTSIRWADRKPAKHKGFDTNASTRESIFGLIKSHINSYEADEYPDIPDDALLKELEACVVGKNGRPDHTSDGSLDTTIAYGQMLFVYKHSPEQVTNNKPQSSESMLGPYERLKIRLGIDTPEPETQPQGLGANIGALRKYG